MMGRVRSVRLQPDQGSHEENSIHVLVATLIAAAGVLSAQAPTGPIRIGFIVPLSGPYAQSGRDILNGSAAARRNRVSGRRT